LATGTIEKAVEVLVDAISQQSRIHDGSDTAAKHGGASVGSGPLTGARERETDAASIKNARVRQSENERSRPLMSLT